MSLRGTKRAAGMRGEEAGTSKRRRTEPEDALWQLRPVSDLKMSSIYNRSASEAPAELFRKDLISAMKLPDNEPLTASSYWVITDTWKQDWERGVQVPVNPDSLPAPKVETIPNPRPPDFQEFKLPKDKYVHLTRDPNYLPDKHIVSSTPARAEAACSYDLDAMDTAWLKLLNAERARAGASPVTEDQLEKVIEELEVRAWDKTQAIVKSEEGLGIEYDENVICDVCRSPDSEDGNEMVFCDACNICVHQACYGITVIPDGQWLCRPCGDGVRPSCVLCPNHGGAMKCTPSGHKWAHVSCVLWIPEVSIGCAEIMEPITKISSIPASRWSLVCVLCRNRKGACIQCSVKTCKTAYHVTCAFKHGLEMRAIIEDENADDGVKLRSYCQKHSVNSKKEKCPGSGSEEEEVKRKRRKDMTSEEKTQARTARLHEIEREFDRHVSVKDISTHLLDVDQDAINYIYNYWKLKRRAGYNRPLLPPKSDDTELLTHRQEQADLDKMKMFVQLRQDLERVRNLCYMVSRREKLSRSFFRMREQTFHKQVAVLSGDAEIPEPELSAIIEANHGPSIYDRLYSHPNAPDHKNDFESLLARIAPAESGDEKKKDRNGMLKASKSSNPYKKHYVNGSRRSGSMYSGLSSEESAPEVSRVGRPRGKTVVSSTDDEGKKPTSPKKKVSPKMKGKKSPKKTERKKKKVLPSKAFIESSSEDETLKSKIKKDSSRSNTLRQMEEEMAAGKIDQSGSDTDELMPIRTTRNTKFLVDIYSDSSEDNIKSDGKTDKVKTEKIKSEKVKPEKSPSGNDSQQSLPRTKGAMKEFIPSHSEKKSVDPEVEKPPQKKRGRKPSNKDKKLPAKPTKSDDEVKIKENSKSSKPKDNPTDLIVPQRQAAKKASENMRSTTVAKKEEPTIDKPAIVEDTKPVKPQLKAKTKGKEIPSTKVGRKKSKEVEKEPIAYVPQRQAAKKAAAHIKSGLGTKLPVPDSDNEGKKKDADKPETSKQFSPKKEEVKPSKTPQKDSSSSSSNSSSSSYSSSSSSEEEQEQEKPTMKPTAKAREIKPAASVRQPSMFSPPGSRPTVDLPFLDKVSKPLSSTSASSDSESSKESDGSRSGSPYPKRPRRRRKAKSNSTDASPRKAPDKKLKTSERGSECRVPSPTPEGEEPSRANVARAATRARTRSTTSGGNMSNKPDAGPRKPSKDDSGNVAGPNKTPKESVQPSELPAAERKADKEIKKELKEEPVAVETPRNDDKPKIPRAKRQIESDEDMDKPITPEVEAPVTDKSSPKKNTETKHKALLNRRMSVKEAMKAPAPAEEVREPVKKDRRLSRHESIKPSCSDRSGMSPIPMTVEKPVEQTSSLHINDDYGDNDKHWLPKAPSPNMNPPAVEKPGGDEKYMTTTDDKSMDSDFADKNSVKMIAKIQANLNENTMIKSPKTPMDARTMDHVIDIDSLTRNTGKRSAPDPENKFITQNASHVQGVEISKSAKIPSTGNPNRAMFSPQSKDNELDRFDFGLMDVDDGFNHDDIIKPFATYPEFFFKEDSKEQSVQATLNLVDRLRLQLSSKKASESSAQEEGMTEKVDKDPRVEENYASKSTSDQEHESTPPNKNAATDIPAERSPPKQMHQPSNSVPHVAAPIERDLSTRDVLGIDKDYQPISMTSTAKWPNAHVSHIETLSQSNDRKYDQSGSYADESKETMNLQSDVQSVSEVGDTISLSKQSDDSQSLSVVDHELTQDNQNYDNNNSLIHSDCATISSPYVSQEKWRESKITTRRSSASSTNSEESISSQKTERKCHLSTRDSRPVNVIPDIDTYPPIPAYSCPVEPSMPLNQYSTYPPDASPFLSSLPMFATGPCGASQLPLPSPGPGLYGSIAYSAASLLPPKPAFPLCAAFTSSSQNIALTTAMIASPTPKLCDSPRDEIDITGSDKFSIHVVSSPSVSIDSFDTNSNRAPTKMSNDSNETMTSMHLPESKSPPKSSKAPIKFPGKSPGKSPGISPRQSDGPKGTKRASNRSNRSQRGRGRSKSRGQSVHGFPPVDYAGVSIQSKLVGTVYDFDEEIANDGVDLKALRERRKSIDVRDDRKSEHSYKDSSQSPRVASPPQTNKRAVQSETKKAKLSTPESAPPDASPAAKSPPERGPGFSHVQPVLPGAVDMRSVHPYQQYENLVPATGGDSYLLAFASGTAEQHLPDIDEEIEKQLHSELMGGNPELGSPGHHAPVTHEPPKQTFMPQLPKVSLSDSRNQLKVKIKGPFLDANYSTSSIQPVAPPPPAPVHEFSSSSLSVPSASASSMIPGSTNLRRMRKKELLRQYWTQDMNMDDPTNTSMTIGAVPPPAVPSPLTRAVITIPKAISSMTSIPTREDYKLTESPIEKKKRKTTSGLSRELRHLEVSMNDDVDPSDDVKLSAIAGSSSQAHKRRGRASSKPNKSSATTPVAPKLKIKIGSNTVQQVNEEPSGFQFRPPKKRLIHSMPSMEDLRRESMKYRRMVMADFEENEKTKKCKPSKSEKRKKKKDKKAEKLQVVNSGESDNATKLIIKIKRKKETGGGGETASTSKSASGSKATSTSKSLSASKSSSAAKSASASTSKSATTSTSKLTTASTSASTPASTSGAGASAAAATLEPGFDPFEYDPHRPDPLAFDAPSYSESTSAMRKIRTAKVTPIRLKLARSSEGSGYVMKEASERSSAAAPAAPPAPPAPPATPASSALPLAVNKHCEVR